MPNMPEIARCANFSFGYLLLLVLALSLVFVFFEVAVQVAVDLLRRVVVVANVVDLWVLDVHRRHW